MILATQDLQRVKPTRRPATPQLLDQPRSYLRASEQDMAWWREARFGLFVHWGPAALCGGDISWCRKGPERLGDHQFVADPQLPSEQYDRLCERFNPAQYDARKWVAIARNAGMKYIVLTAKHHDGFCLFETRLTQHKINGPECPFPRDVVRELAVACHESGMKLGIYYSARDWYHPDYLTQHHDRYLAFYHAQLLELLCNYGKIDMLWFDHIGGTHDQWDPELVFKMARQLQPGILINDRLHASVHHGKVAEFTGDFDTPEQQIGAFQTHRPWESCLCLVGGVWSYKPGGTMMTLAQCIAALVNCAGGDGNLLLNTGPMPDGRIEPRQAKRLSEIGRWLEENGQSIYGTRGGPLLPGEWGACTHRGDNLYLHILKWKSGNDALHLPTLDRRIVAATLLGGGKVRVRQTDDATVVEVPPQHRRAIDTIVTLKMR